MGKSFGHFMRDDVWVMNKPMKRCLVFREMQIKTTMGYICSPMKMVKIISDRRKFWRGRGGTGALILRWWDCETENLKNGWAVSRKLDPCPPSDTDAPLLGVYPRDIRFRVYTDTCPVMTRPTFSVVPQNRKQPERPSADERLNKV